MYYKKICNLALFITSIIVFIIWSLSNGINLMNINNEIVRILVSLFMFISFGYLSFHGLVKGLVYLLEKITLIKKIIFSKTYIEGLWVGYYFSDNKPILCYKEIKQSVDTVNIRGQAYNCDDIRSFRGKWEAVRGASISTSNSSFASLSYTYTLNLIEDRATYEGFTNFDLLEEKTFKNPQKINGYLYNLISQKKIHLRLIKYLDGSNLNYEVSFFPYHLQIFSFPKM